jgi:hypothetical protein
MVAKYINDGGTISHSDGMDLARGVSVSTAIETLGEDNTFYANNDAAEEAQQRFRRGTATLTVDGLLRAAENLILGLPAARSLTVGTGNTVNMTDYGDDQNIPYVTIGFVIRRMSAGVTFYQACVYTKTRFAQFSPSAATQGEDIDWQTTELEARLLRDDTAKHNWQTVSEPLATELEAYNTVRVSLGLAVAETLPGNGAVVSA